MCANGVSSIAGTDAANFQSKVVPLNGHLAIVACTRTRLLLLSCVYLQIYVYSRRKLELHQGVDRALRRIDDI